MAEVRTVEKEVSKAPVKAPKAAKKAPKSDSTQFAVFATGGKQYLVVPGESIKIEKIIGEHKEGDTLTFNDVLVSGTDTDATLGTPFIKGAAISATLKKISRYKTIDVIKYKQKSRYFKKNGHRQPYFEIQIDSIK